MIESGKKTPSASALCLIATRLGISPEDLQRGVRYIADTSSTFFLLWAAQSAYTSGDYDSARVLAVRAMESTSDESILTRAEHLHLASILHLNVTRAEFEEHDRYLEQFQSMNPRSPFVLPVLLNLGALHFKWEDYPTARRCYEVVIRRAKGVKHLQNEYAHAKMYLGTVHYRLGDYCTAVSCFEEAYCDFGTLGNPYQRAHAALGLSGVLGDCGSADEALAWAERSEALFLQEGSSDAALARHNKAVILLALGKLDDVPILLQRCVQDYADEDRREKLASAYEDLARFYLLRDDLDAAMKNCKQAIQLLLYSDNGWLLARVYRRLGEIWRAAGDATTALEYLHVSALILRELAMTAEYEESRKLEQDTGRRAMSGPPQSDK
jgi:tetratricopeptide (TPR) repeat protein